MGCPVLGSVPAGGEPAGIVLAITVGSCWVWVRPVRLAVVLTGTALAGSVGLVVAGAGVLAVEVVVEALVASCGLVLVWFALG